MAITFSVPLVDDDPDTQALFQDTLDHYGIQLAVADNMPSTLAALKQHCPDVIVLDIFLPDTDGYKLLKVIRALPDCGARPIIAATGYYTTDTIGNIQAHRLNGYLLKPLYPGYVRG